MEKSITTIKSISYKLPIADLDCAKQFLAERLEKKRELNIEERWPDIKVANIDKGIDVEFCSVNDSIFKVYAGFHFLTKNMIQIGFCDYESIDDLCSKFEEDPYSFRLKDPNTTMEDAICDLVERLKNGEFTQSFRDILQIPVRECLKKQPMASN